MTPDMEHVSRLLEHITENVRLCCAPEQLLYLMDAFKAATSEWPEENRSRAFWRAVEQGFVEFHMDRYWEQQVGIMFDPPPPWQHHRRKWGW